jgi:hypothetical protein
MELDEQTATGVRIDLTWDELVLFNNALNEVCNGIDVWEFSTRLGATRDEARQLLREVHDLVERGPSS